MHHDAYAQTVMERCDILAACSEEPDRLTRRFATPAMRQAQEQVAAWMRAAGMTVRRDNVGNLIGRYEAARCGAPTLLLGSHLDTVRNAGKYDGSLGVLVVLAAIQHLHDHGQHLPYALELLAFADEEGLRYGTAYLGSAAVAGTFDPSDLRRVDADGIAMAEAMRSPDRGVTFRGTAAHAGTVPMERRRDALCAAAEFVLAVESLALSRPGLVATVGQIAAEPGASNVIPGLATLSLDVRHQDDAVRAAACGQLQQQAAAIAGRRGVAMDWRPVQEHRAVPCAPGLTQLLAEAIAALGYPVVALPSGAGHDAAVLAALTGVAMLFVRCRGGISHHPDESVTAEDLAVALDVLRRFFTLLGQDQSIRNRTVVTANEQEY